MDVELLVTGDELTRGAVVDTNSAWLCQRLALQGARVRRIVLVGDDPELIASTMREASSRAALVVVSGGLGPTSDDLTAECAARLTGDPLELHQPTMARLRAKWAARGQPMPHGLEKQALVPQQAEVLDNDEGSAPGFRLRSGRAWLYFFAGVPAEFRHLCERHLLPFVASRARTSRVTTTLRCVGLPEAKADELLSPLAARSGATLGLRAVFPETWASLTVEESTEEAARKKLAPLGEEARRLLGSDCYSIDGSSLAQVVGQRLLARGETLATAESCTGGLIGGACTDVAGSSGWFVGSVVAYANEVKESALGVPSSLLAAHGAVSAEVACAMATGARERLGSSWAVSVTGVAGPGGGSIEKPVGTVWFALAGPSGVTPTLLRASRPDRPSIRSQSVSFALDLLRRALEGGS